MANRRETYLEIARRVMRERQELAELLETISKGQSVDGQAVELWRRGDRFFIVTSRDEAGEIVKRGISRGEIWTPGEIEMITRIGD